MKSLHAYVLLTLFVVMGSALAGCAGKNPPAPEQQPPTTNSMTARLQNELNQPNLPPQARAQIQAEIGRLQAAPTKGATISKVSK